MQRAKCARIAHFSFSFPATAAMSFGFQFDDDELDDEYKAQEGVGDESAEQAAPALSPSGSASRVRAKRFTLEELLATLPPRISYSSLEVPLQESHATLVRRDLFDARFQLINDDEDVGRGSDGAGEDEKGRGQEATDWERYSAGAGTDLVPGVYEGGLKTWECSLDLIDHLHDRINGKKGDGHWLSGTRVTELGCGTALPSTYLLSSLLAGQTPNTEGTSFHLCDFNEQVLRLVSRFVCTPARH